MTSLIAFLDFLGSSFLLLGPMLLLGLFLAGLIHVFISREAILKWLHRDSLESVTYGAAIGVPMPLCSCSVVPVVAEMRRKGASRSSCMSFLITAPETGADSILVTNAFFGPLAAIVRPFISFITGVVAGIFCIGMIRGDDKVETVKDDHDHHHHDHHHDHDHCGHDHGHKTLFHDNEDCYISPSTFRGLFKGWLSRLNMGIQHARYMTWIKPEFYREMLALPKPDVVRDAKDIHGPGDLNFTMVAKHILHYGFVEVADDILFALLVGVLLGGLLYLAIPSDLMSNEYARWLSYPVMVLVGVPLYICASASTPIAAALVAKGFSPGAALIFLMTGPATNTGTIAIVAKQFGTRFSVVYVGTVIAVTVVLGILVDLLMIAFGLSLAVNLDASDSPVLATLQWAGAFGLFALMAWRFRAGAFRTGYQDLFSNLTPVFVPFKRWWLAATRNSPIYGLLNPRSFVGTSVWLAVIAAFLLSGFMVVRPGEVGYGRLFGKVVWQDLQPGLHYLAPWPVAQADRWPVRAVKTVTSAETDEYLTGDLNLISISMNLQYRVTNPYVYHYRLRNPEQVIGDNIRKELRTFVASRKLDELLNVERATLQEHILEVFWNGIDTGDEVVLSAITPVKASLQLVSPANDAMPAFREVSSSQDDRERIIVNAQRLTVSLIPQAHGNAKYEIDQAAGEAERKKVMSIAESNAIRRVADAVREASLVLQTMLWREKLESALAGRSKIIVPEDDMLNKVALWRSRGGGRIAEPLRIDHPGHGQDNQAGNSGGQP